MDCSLVIKQTEDYVKQTMQCEGSHDWWHVFRVWKTAIRLGEEEKANLFVVQMAALLHDLDDWKLGGDGTPKLAKEWMKKQGLDAAIISHVCEIIGDLSFKGAKVATPMKTIEGKVVQDADRLDAIGAIGIARAFAYGGSKGRLLHDPEIKPEMHDSFEKYKSSEGTTINHFYQKLLLLKNLMNTRSAKRIAEGRHAFMEKYLEEFYGEWNSKK